MADQEMMDAQIKKIDLVPAAFDKHGEVTREEYATVTLKVPMDSLKGRSWVANLLTFLSRDYVVVDIQAMQLPIDEVQKKSVSLSAEDVENQLGAAKEAAD